MKPSERYLDFMRLGVRGAIVCVLLLGACTSDHPSQSLLRPGIQTYTSGDVTRTVSASGVTFSVKRQNSLDGACIDVAATLDGVVQGSVGGCGEPDNPLLRWGIGGIKVAKDWFNVAYGEVPQLVDSVRVTLGDGTVLTDTGVGPANGLWLVVVPGDPTSTASDFIRIIALDAEGTVIAEEETPSLVSYRLQMAQSVQEESKSHGP
jgi:hypothetical protein